MPSSSGDREFISTAGIALAFKRFSPNSEAAAGSNTNNATVLMLHEGLGSVGQWRDLPQDIANRSGLEVVAYERSGYGRSDPTPTAYGSDFMATEAEVVLPEVLAQLGIEQAVLVGHSDGATIALITAVSNRSLVGVVAIAPHTFVEDISVASIEAVGDRRDQLVAALAKYHDHPGLVFDRWRNVWLSKDFRHWSITSQLPEIACPVLVIQGNADEYGTAAQVSAIVDGAPRASGHLLDDCGHVAHRDQPEQVLNLICEFLASLTS